MRPEKASFRRIPWVFPETCFSCKFSINSGCIKKIPLNPPLQKGEAVGMPGLFEKSPFFTLKIQLLWLFYLTTIKLQGIKIGLQI